MKKLRGEWSANISIELDSLQRLHLHAIMYTQREPYYKSVQEKGWTIHFQRGDAILIWNYINKYDQSTPAKDERENLSYYHYIDTLLIT